MRLSRIVLAALFVSAGAAHFVRRNSFVDMVPTWLPNAALLVAVSGVAEVAGGLGLLVPTVRRAAGWGLIALLIAVFPANIHMLADARATGASAAWQAALWIRLPLQPLLMWWVWRASIRVNPAPVHGYVS
jgi:uncharacterized membrane protein